MRMSYTSYKYCQWNKGEIYIIVLYSAFKLFLAKCFKCYLSLKFCSQQSFPSHWSLHRKSEFERERISWLSYRKEQTNKKQQHFYSSLESRCTKYVCFKSSSNSLQLTASIHLHPLIHFRSLSCHRVSGRVRHGEITSLYDLIKNKKREAPVFHIFCLSRSSACLLP